MVSTRSVYSARKVQIFSTETLVEKIISYNGCLRCPARTPLDFYLRGYVKNEVYINEGRPLHGQQTGDLLIFTEILSSV